MKDKTASVCVLMSVFNGERYLEDQLESLLTQESVTVTILVRDDGSTDDSTAILSRWQSKGLLTWYSGLNMGPARSFLDLLAHAPNADFYAFCDQDDVWLTDKLIVAVDSIVDIHHAAMYSSAFQMVDSRLNPIETPSHDHRISFAQSLVTNYTTGCTVVMNKYLADVINTHTPDFIMMHDSWAVKSCLAIGGSVIYDNTPHILYRQHERNVVGGKSNKFKKNLTRFRSLLHPKRSRYKEAMSLLTYKNLLTIQNESLLSELKNYYYKPLSYRLKLSKSFMSGNPSRDRIVRMAFLLKQF